MGRVSSAIEQSLREKQVVREFQFESATQQGKFYKTRVYADGSMSCNCPGWAFSLRKHGTRQCKHTKEVAHGIEGGVRVHAKASRNLSAGIVRSPEQGKKSVPVTVVLNRATRRFDFDDE